MLCDISADADVPVHANVIVDDVVLLLQINNPAPTYNELAPHIFCMMIKGTCEQLCTTG